MRMISDQLREERKDRSYSPTFYYDPLLHGKMSSPPRRLKALAELSTDNDPVLAEPIQADLA